MTTRYMSALVSTLIAVGILLMTGLSSLYVTPIAAEAPPQPLFQVLKDAGIDRLQNGVAYDLGGGLTVTFDAKNGLGSPIEMELVKRTGKLIHNPSVSYTGIFAEKAPRASNAAPASANPEPEDANVTLTFSVATEVISGTTIDNDPKYLSSGYEDGAVFHTPSHSYVVPVSQPNKDNEVATIAIGEKVNTIRFTSQDSWHFLLMVRIPEKRATATPTHTTTPTSTPTSSPTPTTPVIPPPTTQYTVYLVLVMGKPVLPPPTATPSPSSTPVANDCAQITWPGHEGEIGTDRNGNRFVKPPRGAQVLLRASSLTGSTAELSIYEGSAQVSPNNEFSFRANPGTRHFEARFNNAPAVKESCKIRVEVSSGNTPPTATPQPPTPTAAPPTQPPAPTNTPRPIPSPTNPPAVIKD